MSAGLRPSTELASNVLQMKQHDIVQEASLEGGRTVSVKADELSVDNTYDILEAMYDARDKWRNIGGIFHVPESTLRCIALEEADNEGKLRRVIIAWLEREGGTGNCTWALVVSALRNKTVNRSDVAGEVCEKHLPKSMSPSVSSAHSRNDGSAVTPSATQLPQHSIEPVTSKLYILMKVQTLGANIWACARAPLRMRTR